MLYTTKHISHASFMYSVLTTSQCFLVFFMAPANHFRFHFIFFVHKWIYWKLYALLTVVKYALISKLYFRCYILVLHFAILVHMITYNLSYYITTYVDDVDLFFGWNSIFIKWPMIRYYWLNECENEAIKYQYNRHLLGEWPKNLLKMTNWILKQQQQQ